MEKEANDRLELLLTEEEEHEILIETEGEKETKSKGKHTLVGTLLTTRPFNVYAMQATIKGSWKLKRISLSGS